MRAGVVSNISARMVADREPDQNRKIIMNDALRLLIFSLDI